MKKLISVLLILTMFLALPSAVSAKYFDIESFKIDARLQEDGQAKVTEKLTYRFSGAYNGITRTLYPKTGSAIEDVKAFENGRELPVEGTTGEFKIHRKAEDETVTVELTYMIDGGVRAFSDMADFYWPFFDDRNETEFKDVTITVHPPAPTQDVIAFGYDAALTEPAVESDGTVTFRLGKVPAETNGDIRVGYGMDVFPAITDALGTDIGPTLHAEKEKQDAKLARYDRFYEAGKIAAPATLLIGVALLAGLLLFMSRRKKDRRREAKELYPAPYFVPDQLMSLPATIKFTDSLAKLESLQTAALLDLMRKGNIERVDDEGFRLLSRETDHEHERLLLEWLFDEMGDGELFRYSDLDVLDGKHTAAEKAAQAYSKSQSEWNGAVSKEISASDVHGTSKAYALLSIGAAVVLIPFMIVYAVYGHPWWLIGFIPLALLLILTGIFNHPDTVKGYGIRSQWKSFADRMPKMTESDFTDRLDDEQKRAVIYAIGTNTFKEEEMSALEASPLFQHNPGVLSYFVLASLSVRQFTHADTAVAYHYSNSSSTGSSGGGGAGGGGGGAGAF